MACRLHIKVCEAKKVLKMDLGGKSDPYVTLGLKSQDKKNFLKTQVISNTTDPIWNQEFDIVATDPNDVLLINMYDEDIKSDDKMMEQLEYPVNTWPVGGPLDRKEVELKLKKKKAGTLIFEVQAFPAEGLPVQERAVNIEPPKEQCLLHIKAFDAKDVLKMDLGGKSDPYLRFRFKGDKKSAVKTQVISNTKNPIWNQELSLQSKDRNTDILEVDMLDEDVKNDDYMMDRITIPLSEHPFGTHYTFDNDIKLKKKKAGHLHFEIDFIPADGSMPEPQVQTREVTLPEQDLPAERCRVRVHAIKGENLLNMDADIGSLSDPFVTMQIKGAPEYAKMRTKTVDTNLNPVWDQTFELDCDDRNKDVLLINLLDEDINKDDQMMDQLEFPLNKWPIGTHFDYADNIKFKDQDAGKLYLGIDVIDPLPIQTFDERDIFIEEPEQNYCNFTLGTYPSTFSTDFTGYSNWDHSLSPINSQDLKIHHHHHEGFRPVQQRDIQLEPKATRAGESIKGRIVKANGLPKTDNDGSDTYCVLTVIQKGGKDKKGEKVKTDIIHDTQDPEWNKEFEFVNARPSDSLRAEIFQYHKVLGDQCIACVEVELNTLKENQPIEQAFTLDKPPKIPKIVKKVTDFGTLTLNLVHQVNYQ